MSNVQGLFSTTIGNPSGYPGQSFFGQNNIRIFMRTGTFTVPPGVSTIRVRVHGAGGSGAVATASTLNRCATGGGGGGFTMKVISTTPGTAYTVTVGAGGTRAQTLANGVAGGTSSFGAILTATGGGGGLYVSSGVANSAAGAAGGTGSGGDVNYTGGSSGTATTSSTNATYQTFVATGGGSCASIYGNGGASGSVTLAAVTSGASGIYAASSGGGVGGKSGDITYTGTGSGGFYIFSSAGGTAGPSVDYTTSTNPGGNITSLIAGPGFMNYASSGNGLGASSFSASYYGGIPLETYSAIYRFNTYVPASTVTVPKSSPYPLNSLNRFPGDILMAGGTTPQDQEDNGGNPSPGAGMGSRFGAGNQYVAGPLGGGGAAVDPSNNGSYGGGATIGGGGGALVSRGSTDTNAFSGYGGDGMVIVEW